MISGIYNIRNIVNDNIYIGSSSNIEKRFNEHKHMLLHNKHVNTHLQRSFNKYGSDKFIFEVIEYVCVYRLIEFEQLYIDLFQPEYNIRKVAHSNMGIKWSFESREKASERMKGSIPCNKGTIGVSDELGIG